ncbi:hypothetical protein ABZV64_06410 [Streptomyces sp. NPDC004959]|uniref:hypothetical protein n=1 Tax=Streptomyces sp. NPDC004959 TaxID=3154673 RepID=UPI0033B8A1EA
MSAAEGPRRVLVDTEAAVVYLTSDGYGHTPLTPRAARRWIYDGQHKGLITNYGRGKGGGTRRARWCLLEMGAVLERQGKKAV